MPHRIVVVDDDVETCEVLGELLTLQGHDVWTAHTAGEGIAAAIAESASVVISDINLPDISGREIPRRLRSAMPASPVCIAVTGDTGRRDRDESLGAGFLAHLTKPLKLALLDELLALAEGADASSAPERQVPTRYIATYCEECRQLALAVLGQARNLSFSCARCGGSPRMLPGGSYSEAESVRLMELAASVENAQLAPHAALQALQELETAMGGPAAFGRCVQLLPMLQSTRPTWSEPERDAAVRMMRTLLNAVAFGPRLTPDPRSE